jgi:hypothetical protein
MNDFLTRVDDLLTRDRRTKRWLAEQINRSENTVYSWYYNDRQIKLDDAVAVAHALGVSVSYLVYGEDVSAEEPQKDTVHLSMEMPKSVYEQVRDKADAEDRTVEMQIIHSVKRCLKE